MGLSQIGEFSFIIASLGLSLKVTSGFLYPIAVAVSALTTLTTPYLIRSSDGVVELFTKFLPPRLLDRINAYTAWVGQLSTNKKGKKSAGIFLRKWGWQIALNLLLIAGVFIGAVYLKDHGRGWVPEVPGGENGWKGAIWLTAMILSLPMLIAVVRKWQAFGMLVGEISVSRAAAGENTAALRAVVSRTIFVGGCAGLILFLLLLSSAVLPSWNLLVVLALILAATTLLMRRAFIRVHSKAQIALHETLSQPPAIRHEETAQALPSLLRHAELVLVGVQESSPVAGKLIAELQLRTLTGASIVGIERGEENLINPGIEEELRAGDSVLLLGSVSQIKAARNLIEGGAASNVNQT
jgi:CPA2 family monovalent cation:H+ antiporter-2